MADSRYTYYFAIANGDGTHTVKPLPFRPIGNYGLLANGGRFVLYEFDRRRLILHDIAPDGTLMGEPIGVSVLHGQDEQFMMEATAMVATGDKSYALYYTGLTQWTIETRLAEFTVP